MKRRTSHKIDQMIRDCQKSKTGSQKRLYEHFFSYAMSIGLRYSNSYEEAVEIVNDSYLKVFDKIKAFKNNNFRAWFRRIIINTATDHFRKNQKHYYHDSFDANERLDITAEELIEAQMSYEELLKLVQQLTPAYRTVFNLYVIDGFKHEEIAQKLDISVGTSKSNLARARQMLKGLIKKTFGYEYSKVIGQGI